MSLVGYQFTMKWITYRQEFEKKATENSFTQDEIASYLEYGKILFDKKLPIIYDQRHLSLLVGYREEFIRKATNSPSKFYRTFKISKKSGGERFIAEPLPSLKEIQRWILDEILYKCLVSGYAKAYIPKRSIINNAQYHINKVGVLTLDIDNFFPSLRWKKVYNFFFNLGYSESVAMSLSRLCCLNDALPQGAPTSPALSNLLMRTFDKRIVGFVKKREINYTRYADDMAFSGDFEPGMVIKFVKSILSDMDLKINEKKTRFRHQNQRQEVTGITVNRKMQVSKEIRKNLRQSIYYIQKFGIGSHLEKTNDQRANSIRHLLGIANFVLFINPEDEEAQNYKKYLIECLIIE